MKRRTQKIFITLLSLFIAGFAMVNAYTFEVLNWNPFGVLNLKTLIMKPDVNTTGIVIDGASYTIKIDPNHETEDGGIWVDRICDESGVNCKKVSELGIGGGGAIVIEGDAENFCFKKDDTTLICNNEFLRSLIESWGLGGSINIDGQDKNYCYRSKETNTLYCDNTNLPTGNGSTPGNGKITIIQGSNEREFFLNGTGDKKITLSNGGGTTSGAIAYGSGEYICVKNGNNLDCSKAKLGELKPAKRCTFDGTSINCTEDEPTGGGTPYTLIAATTSALGGIKIGYSQSGKNYPVKLDGNNNAYVNVPREAGEGGDGGIEIIDKVIGGRCKYDTSGSYSLLGGDGKTPGGTIETGIICTYSAPTGDGLRESSKVSNGSTTSNNVLLHPKSISQDLYISGDIWHDGAVTIKTLGSTTAARENTVTIHQQGVAIGELPNKTAGLGVHGPISVGRYSLTEQEINSVRPGQCSQTTQRNTISIYASGSAGTDNFEILGSPRILVGVKNGGYLYFDNNNKLGINTTGFNSSSTLTVNGPVKIGNDCSNRDCSEANKGEIRYFESNNVGHFVGCTKTSSGYQRRDLTIGTTQPTIATNNNCNGYNPPYNPSIYSQTIAQQTVCN